MVPVVLPTLSGPAHRGRRRQRISRGSARRRKGKVEDDLCKKCVHANKRFDDQTISPVIRQTMLHWAYEITEQDVKDVMKRM